MDRSDVRQRLQDLYGSTLSDDEAFLNRIINDAYSEICAVSDWWWLQQETTVTYDAPITTKNLVFTEGASTATFATTADAVTTAYTFGWLSTGTYLAEITSVSTADVTIDAGWVGSSATAECTIWSDIEEISTTCRQVIALLPRYKTGCKPLEQVEQEDIESYGPHIYRYKAKWADRFAVYRDAEKLRIRIFPPPSQKAVYALRYIPNAPELSSDATTILMPVAHHPTLVAASMLRLAKLSREDPDFVSMLEVEYQRGISRMLHDQNKKGKLHAQIKPRGVREGVKRWFRLTNVEEGGV